jgi:putative phosphoribosyl transferase
MSTGPADMPAEQHRRRHARVEVSISTSSALLPGTLTWPEHASGIVVFAHGSGSSRLSPRNRAVAQVLNDAGLGTLLFDLLTPAEEANRANVFDIALLGHRLVEATGWLVRRPEAAGLPLGYFGASTGAAAALWAAAEPQAPVAAVVSRGGRPDLAGARLPAVAAPTLLIVGSLDTEVLELNRVAAAAMQCETALTVVPAATHLFEEPGTLDLAADAARLWFLRHLTRHRAPEPTQRGEEAPG